MSTEETCENTIESYCTLLNDRLELVHMPPYIAYYRVSTNKQGQSGLGLDAQREAVAQFLKGETPLAEYVEVESGKAVKNRPQLAAALGECRKKKATLVIAKLDRLARNVHFISGLMESKVNFVAADMPKANDLNLHVMAAFAQHEAKMISERTVAALAQVKRELEEKGSRVSRRSGNVFTKLGNPHLAEARAKAAAAHRTPPPPATVEFIAKMRAEKQPLRQIVQQLNALNIKTGRDKQWYASTVRAVLLRQEGAA